MLVGCILRDANKLLMLTIFAGDEQLYHFFFFFTSAIFIFLIFTYFIFCSLYYFYLCNINVILNKTVIKEEEACSYSYKGKSNINTSN